MITPKPCFSKSVTCVFDKVRLEAIITNRCSELTLSATIQDVFVLKNLQIDDIFPKKIL